MKKLYLYISLVVVVIGTGGYFWLSGSNGKDIKYRTEKISRGSVVVNVRATGTINPVKTVQVGSQVSGIVQKIFVDFNSQVKQNQVIAQIDSTFLYASVKEVEASLEHSKAQMNNAQRNLSRTTELFKKDLSAQADLDAAKTAYESAVADFKQGQASLDRARVNLQYALIRSPIDGVVISRDVDVGQTVAASFQTPKLFSIANDLKRMQVEASVDEADIGQIVAGQDVTFTVDAYPEEQFHGEVAQIRLEPITVQNVVTYTVIIDVPNPELKLRPGMTATVSVLVDKRDDVVRVPSLALRFQPSAEVMEAFQKQKSQDTTGTSAGNQRDGGGRDWKARGQRGGRQGADSAGQSKWMRNQGGGSEMGLRRKMARIWILDNGRNLRPVMVTAGLNDNRYVEIIGGEIKEGDEVVLGSLGNETASSGTQQNNPFQTRMPGGGGGGRRGM